MSANATIYENIKSPEKECVYSEKDRTFSNTIITSLYGIPLFITKTIPNYC